MVPTGSRRGRCGRNLTVRGPHLDRRRGVLRGPGREVPEVIVHEPDADGTLAGGRRDPLHRTTSHVTGREDAGHGGGEAALVARGARDDESPVVTLDRVGEP